MELFKTWWSDDPVMGEVVGLLSCHPEGRKQLRRAGLMPPMTSKNEPPLQHREHIVEFSDSDDSSDSEEGGVANNSDIYMTNSEDTAGVVMPSYGDSRTPMTRPRPQRRRRDESLEEQALRRRRREAMVLSEGGRPLGQDNIIQRPVNGSAPGEAGAGVADDSEVQVEPEGQEGILEQRDEEQVDSELEQLAQEVTESAEATEAGGRPAEIDLPEGMMHNSQTASRSWFDSLLHGMR